MRTRHVDAEQGDCPSGREHRAMEGADREAERGIRESLRRVMVRVAPTARVARALQEAPAGKRPPVHPDGGSRNCAIQDDGRSRRLLSIDRHHELRPDLHAAGPESTRPPLAGAQKGGVGTRVPAPEITASAPCASEAVRNVDPIAAGPGSGMGALSSRRSQLVPDAQTSTRLRPRDFAR